MAWPGGGIPKGKLALVPALALASIVGCTSPRSPSTNPDSGPSQTAVAPTSAQPTPTAPSATVSPQQEYIQVEGSAAVIDDLLECVFKLSPGFGGKKLIEGAVTITIDVTSPEDVSLRVYERLRPGDETTDGEVSRGTGNEDEVAVFESIPPSVKGAVGCEVTDVSSHGEPIRFEGETSVAAEQ